MEFVILIYGISIILSIAVIICFFRMASNIGAIRKLIESGNNSPSAALSEFNKHTFWGDKDLATSKLKEAFWLEFSKIKLMLASEDKKVEEYEKLRKRYQPAFEGQGIQIPDWRGE